MIPRDYFMKLLVNWNIVLKHTQVQQNRSEEFQLFSSSKMFPPPFRNNSLCVGVKRVWRKREITKILCGRGNRLIQNGECFQSTCWIREKGLECSFCLDDKTIWFSETGSVVTLL